MSHSKRNTSLAFFTSYERALLKGDYGKQRARLGRDSFKALDACNLCLTRARDPVSCPQGDLFCRECVVENLLAQRRETKRRQIELDQRIKKEDAERMAWEQKFTHRAVKDFELLQMGLESGRDKLEQPETEGDHQDYAGPTVAGVQSGLRKRKFELDREEVQILNQEGQRRIEKAMALEENVENKRKLPSFWVPSLTPSFKRNKSHAKDMRLVPICPASPKGHTHNLSLKTLVNVRFTDEIGEKTVHGDPQRICPCCRKALSNAVKAYIANPCGHVLCKPCGTQFISLQLQDTERAISEPRCFECSTKLSVVLSEDAEDERHYGLMLIQSDGTGFSAAGGNVTTEKEGIAFQC